MSISACMAFYLYTLLVLCCIANRISAEETTTSTTGTTQHQPTSNKSALALLQPFSVTAQQLPNVTIVMRLIEKSPIVQSLDRSRDTTVFLPNDAAIYESGLDQNGSALSKEARRHLLQTHVIPSAIKIHDMPPGVHTWKTLDESQITLNVSSTQLEGSESRPTATVNIGDHRCTQEATILNPEKPVECANGVIYIISNVLIPSQSKETVEQFRPSRCV